MNLRRATQKQTATQPVAQPLARALTPKPRRSPAALEALRRTQTLLWVELEELRAGLATAPDREAAERQIRATQKAISRITDEAR